MTFSEYFTQVLSNYMKSHSCYFNVIRYVDNICYLYKTLGYIIIPKMIAWRCDENANAMTSVYVLWSDRPTSEMSEEI